MFTFKFVLETFLYNNLVKYDICDTKNSNLMLISRGCSWVSMKRGGCKFGVSITRGCPFSKRGGGAVVSQLAPKLKVSPPLYHEVSTLRDAPPGQGATPIYKDVCPDVCVSYLKLDQF